MLLTIERGTLMKTYAVTFVEIKNKKTT
jgi:hypothetical protein